MKRTAKEGRTPQTPAAQPEKGPSAYPHALPRVVIRGRVYFRDDRLQEFRAVGDPTDRIPFDVMHWVMVVSGGKWPE